MEENNRKQENETPKQSNEEFDNPQEGAKWDNYRTRTLSSEGLEDDQQPVSLTEDDADEIETDNETED